MRDLLFVGLFALFLTNTHAADINDLTYDASGKIISLIEQDGVWKYLDDGSDLGTAWREPNFDDSAWSSGPAGLGFGNGGIFTTLNRGPSTARNVTFYFRKEFNVTSAQLNFIEGDDSFYQIPLGLQRDDGAVIYINGQELYRDNMPAGEITWNTLATSSANGINAMKFFEASPEGTGTLVSGKNVIAVEVHQSFPNSTSAGFNMWMSAGDGVIITDCAEDAAGDLVIPKIIEGKPVIGIAASAFSRCTSLTSITIPDSVTSIGNYGFYKCEGLKSITIPNSVTSIGGWAFSGCASLTSITIPDSVTSIGDGAFSRCARLKKIRFLGNAPTIGSSVFASVSLDALISISKNANGFGTSFGGIMIEGASVLSLLSYEVIDDKITVTDCDSAAVGDLLIPEIIDDKVVTEIAASAFDGCKRLKSVTLPQSVTSIGEQVFKGCRALSEILVNEENKEFVSINGVLFSKDYSKLIAYPAGKTDIPYTIPDSVTSIGGSAFYSCQNLNEITIPDGVTSIGESAFHSCMFLNSITIPDSVTTIGESAFRNCDRMASVTIGNGVKTIERYSFYDCDNLVSLIIPDSVITIGHAAFSKCDDLLWVTIGDNVSLIQNSAFEGCSQLTSIRIPESVTSIKGGVFGECNRLRNITFDSETAPEISPASFSQRVGNDLVVYVPKNSTGYGAWANPNNYTIESIDPKFENVDCSIIKLKDNENIRLSFSLESEKEYYIQRSFDLKHWDFIRSNIFQTTDTPDITVIDSKLIFDEQQQKKALVPTEDIGNDWIQLNYDDSNWLDVESVSEDGTLVGGGVGFARSGTRVDPFDPYIALDLEEQMYGTNASVYIRIPFTIDDLSEIDSLILAARTDDGFVAWLNGNKVQSFKAPDEPQWDSGATASNSDSIAQNLKEFSLDDHIDKLRVGQNIITIQALNKGKSGSDFLFSCNLLVKRIVKSDNPDFSINSDFSIDYPLINPTNQNQLRSQFYRVISQ